MSVELFHQSICIGTMDHAGFFDRLPTGGGTAQSAHADLEEVLGGLDVLIQNVTDQGLLGNGHLLSLRI